MVIFSRFSLGIGAEVILGDIIKEQYEKFFERGPPAYFTRLAFGLFYDKERMNWSDEDTVDQIRANHNLKSIIK